MLSRLINRKTIGAVLVLIGFLFAIGLAGSCDVGSVPLLKAVLGAVGCLGMMGIGTKLIGGGLDD